MKKFLIYCTLLFMTASCSDSGPSSVPSIAFESITPETVVANQDIVTITISYLDGDGDLGENNADVKNLFVTDSRNQVRYSYRIPALAPENSNIAISGQLPIELTTVSVLDENADSETVVFSVQVIDQAGNESNIVETPSITISR